MECLITFHTRPECIGCYCRPTVTINALVWGTAFITHFISIVCCVVVTDVFAILTCSVPTDPPPAGDEQQVSSNIVHTSAHSCEINILQEGNSTDDLSQ